MNSTSGSRPRSAPLNFHLSHLTPHCPPPPRPDSQAAAEAEEWAKKEAEKRARKEAEEHARREDEERRAAKVCVQERRAAKVWVSVNRPLRTPAVALPSDVGYDEAGGGIDHGLLGV